MGYDAFISYSHAADSMLAPKLQTGLTKLAKPWHRRKALNIFRDTTGLTANPGLWTSITTAMDDSEWFVFLASPDAASSPWVNRELEHWLSNRPVDRVLPVVTDGEWAWNTATNDFDMGLSTAVPLALCGVFSEEPRHVDMRWARSEEHLDLRHSRFRDQVAEIAAPMHGLAKDELEGEDVRQHRRTLRFAWGAVVALLFLTLLSGGAGVVAASNARRAEDRRLQAEEAQVLAEERQQAAELAEAAEEDSRLAAEESAEEARLSADEADRQAGIAEKNEDEAERQEGIAELRAAEAAESARLAAIEEQKALKSATDALRAEGLARVAEDAALDSAQKEALAAETAKLAQRQAEASAQVAREEEAKARKAEAAAVKAQELEEIARLEAQRQRDVAVSESLSRSSSATDGPLSQLLAVEAVTSSTGSSAASAASVGPAATADAASVRAYQALLAAVAKARGAPNRHPVETYVSFPDPSTEPSAQWQPVLSPDGSTLATVEFGAERIGDGVRVPARIFLWDLTASPPSVRILPGHPDQITKVEFADSGRILVSTDFDSSGSGAPNLVRVWDAETGALLGERSDAYAQASPDGQFVVITSVVGTSATTEVYDAVDRFVTATKPATVMYTDKIGSGSFSPDGAWAMAQRDPNPAVAGDEYAVLLDLAGSAGVGELPLLGPATTSTLPSVDPSGTIATAVLEGGFLGLFDLGTGTFVDALPFANTIADVAWSSDGSLLGAIDVDGLASVLRFDDVVGPDDFGFFIPTTYGACSLGSDPSCNTELDFSPNGARLLIKRSADVTATYESEIVDLPSDLANAASVATIDGTVHAIGGEADQLMFIERNLNDGNDANDTSFALEALVADGGCCTTRTIIADDPALALLGVVVSPDGTRISVATRDGRIRLWGLDDGWGPTEVASTASPRVGVAFDPGAQRLIGVGSGPHTVWDITRRGFGETFSFGQTTSQATLTGDGSTVVEVDTTNRIVRRNVTTNQVTPGPALPPSDTVDYLVWGPDGHTVYANLTDGTSRVVDLTTNTIIDELPGQVATVTADGRLLALRRAGDRIDVLRRDTLGLVESVLLDEGLPAHPLGTTDNVVALSPDGLRLAAVSPMGDVAVWDLTSGSVIASMDGSSQDPGFLDLQGLSFSPDGSRLVVKTPSNNVTIYETDEFDAIATRQIDTQDIAGRVVWSPDGALVIVDGIYVFDGTTLEPLSTKLALLPSSSLRFTDDGRYMMAIETVFSGGDTLHITKRYPVAVDDLVDLACGVAGRNLTQEEWDRFLAASADEFHPTCP